MLVLFVVEKKVRVSNCRNSDNFKWKWCLSFWWKLMIQGRGNERSPQTYKSIDFIRLPFIFLPWIFNVRVFSVLTNKLTDITPLSDRLFLVHACDSWLCVEAQSRKYQDITYDGRTGFVTFSLLFVTLTLVRPGRGITIDYVICEVCVLVFDYLLFYLLIPIFYLNLQPGV